jgi:hypothetical protein
MRSILLVRGCVTGAFALCTLAAGLCLRQAGAAQIQDDQNAFNGYVMQAPLSQYPSLKVLKTWSAEFTKEVGLYENPGEMLTVNGVSLQRVRYRFADQQLESILLVYEGRDNRDKLLRWLEEHYAKLTPYERKMINQVEWHGNLMAITLSYDSGSKQGALWFISPELNHKLRESIASMPD